MLPVASYTFTIPANGSFPLQCAGRYFRINAATGSLKVDGQGSFGTMGTVNVGQGLRLRPTDPAFQRLSFVDTSGAPNIVTVVIADADFVDNTVLGTVSVVDGNKSRSLAGGAFAWKPLNGLGGTLPHSQLWNPAGSGKNLVIDAIQVTASVACVINVGTYNTVLTTAAQAPNNVRSDSAVASVAQGWAQVFAGLTFTRNFGSMYVAANGQVDFSSQLKRPIVIAPNTGLVIAGDVGANTISGYVSYFEDPQ